MTRKAAWIAALATVIVVAGCRRDEPVSSEQEQQLTGPPVPLGTGAERVPAESGLVGGAGTPVEGTVVSMDDESLVLRGDAGERHELALDERTLFIGPDGGPLGRGALQEGARVQAHYTDRPEGMVVVEVRVAPAER
jgi:hypothetical protein